MLAGRVNAKGPYGWHAQNPDLIERLREGFGLHWWANDNKTGADDEVIARGLHLTTFLRKGLVPPPREERDLTAEEQKGRRSSSARRRAARGAMWRRRTTRIGALGGSERLVELGGDDERPARVARINPHDHGS